MLDGVRLCILRVNVKRSCALTYMKLGKKKTPHLEPIDGRVEILSEGLWCHGYGVKRLCPFGCMKCMDVAVVRGETMWFCSNCDLEMVHRRPDATGAPITGYDQGGLEYEIGSCDPGTVWERADAKIEGWLLENGLKVMEIKYAKINYHICTNGRRKRFSSCKKCDLAKCEEAKKQKECSFCTLLATHQCEWCMEQKRTCFAHGIWLSDNPVGPKRSWMCQTCQSDFLESVAEMADAVQDRAELDRIEGDLDEAGRPRAFELCVDAWHNVLAKDHPDVHGCLEDLGLTRAYSVCGNGLNSHITWEPNWQSVLTVLGLFKNQPDLHCRLVSRLKEV